MKVASIYGLLISFVATSVFSQELSLFEDIDRNDENARRPQRTAANPVGSADPEFTLVGVARFGNEASITIQDSAGQRITLKNQLESQSSIPGYPGFSLKGIDANQVTIQYPEGVFCVENQDAGVACVDERNAILTLSNASPLIAPDVASDIGRRSAQTAEQEEPLNPFEALRQRSRNPDAPVQAEEQFRPRRINPDEVPTGMRVVSTPFGDRLVEDI